MKFKAKKKISYGYINSPRGLATLPATRTNSNFDSTRIEKNKEKRERKQ